MMGPISYIGGKRRLAPVLVPLIPEHTTYVEPFAGGAQLFFHKPRSDVEVLNDLDGEVVNFLHICQKHPQELARVLAWQPASRQIFEHHQRQPPELLTDIERAASFFYLQKNAWGGRRRRSNFHYAVTKPSNYRPASLPKRLTDAADRLSEVQIEHLPYQEVLARFDRPSTFFYLDPPYVGVDLYAHNFSDEQFGELADRLGTLQGKFLLSINDCDKARAWFSRFSCRSVRLTYTAVKRPQAFDELLFANFPLEDSNRPDLDIAPTK